MAELLQEPDSHHSWLYRVRYRLLHWDVGKMLATVLAAILVNVLPLPCINGMMKLVVLLIPNWKYSAVLVTITAIAVVVWLLMEQIAIAR
jgi:hypothetical protein